jgi:microcompartment protein CcmL/EutN
VLIGGGVAEVRASHARGVEVAADTLLDSLLIPQVHPMVLSAARGVVPRGDDDALGVIETLTASAAIVAADRAAKAARVTLRDLRLANGIGGKGVLYLTGEVGEVEAAVAAGRDEARRRGLLARAVVIPRLHAQMKERIR